MINNLYDSVLDIIGPEMIGPSSSHTAGAVRIGLACRSILNSPLKNVKIELYNSFAETGFGHGTEKAILAGLLGLSKSDERIKYSDKIMKKKRIKYTIKRILTPNNYKPNTAIIKMKSNKLTVEVVAVSIGGGLILIEQIDGFEVNITAENETLIITHKDKLGILAKILNILATEKMNIVSINSVRHNKLEDIKTIITFDNFIEEKIREKIMKLDDIIRVRIIHKIKEIW
ncbi:MAG TPA: L-serine ammonia-lyase, iron-sulfur-dependent subunit beta [bacterium]|nr:L-serine ammonia-lyase, iron-sulfur-dependent subunit beta [bacterium]HOL48695.1 L-serine ammonia-lyase, iron-sulfur-dependent subunit beta [bacterium]HPQ18096.1 L-serine ammonia-lyase, iron-sulfur-dependent subunit beta [bacterium]